MKFNLKIQDKDIEVEVNDIVGQASGSVFIRCGDTLVLSTCCMSKTDRENLGFFPLTVEYQEKYYAGGKIKGARYVRREGKPSDEAVLNSRLIDRSIRPLFPKGLKREVQVISTVLAWDGENDPDILALISASIALTVSDIPFNGPIGATRISKKQDKFLSNINYEEREDNNIVFVGTERDKKVLINMIEGGLNEISEKEVLEALDLASKDIKKIIDFIKEIEKKLGKKKLEIEEDSSKEELKKELRELISQDLEKAFFKKDKTEREIALEEIKKRMLDLVEEKYEEEIEYVKGFFDEELDSLFHKKVIEEDKRPDGRKLDEVRAINSQTQMVPRAHGSALFCRGLTKALSVLTLGPPGDQQLIEGMEVVGQKRFMHHYNFPPYSVGEVGFLRGPGRREIGHGMLAEKALRPLIPNIEEFPYTIRIVTEILSSNGSSSMASVSASSLALMDAGVPIKRLATGIAIGLAKDKVLTDIQGPEDHYGDMDFKVAGTKIGITAIQMDVKIDGIDAKIFKEALDRAKKARLEIIEKMEKTISEPRKQLSAYAPRIMTLQIKPEKIREVIGSGGKTINEIIEKTGAQIDIEDSGLVYITAEQSESAEEALTWIKNIVREVQRGEVFEGTVKRIMDFGAFVEVLPNQEGLIHISKLSPKRVNKVEDVVKMGDKVSVKVIEIDKQGRINLALIKKI